MELLAIIAENEYIRIENERRDREKFVFEDDDEEKEKDYIKKIKALEARLEEKALLSGTRCPHLTQKGQPCKNNGLCKVHGVSSMLRK